MHKTETEFLIKCKKQMVDPKQFKCVYKISQNKALLPYIFEICYMYVDYKDYIKTIVEIINENMEEFEKWISTNNIVQHCFIVYADRYAHFIVARVNTLSYDAINISKAITCFNKFLKWLPISINNIGHRNVFKIIKKMDKQNRQKLISLLNFKSENTIKNEYIIMMRVLLLLDDSKIHIYHINEFIRLEYLKTCKTSEKILEFMKYNQFIENVSVRLEYTAHIRNILGDHKIERTHQAQITDIVIKMCKSDVKMRRELGVRLLEVLTNLNICNCQITYAKLSFDSYQEIRDIALKYVSLNFERSFLLYKLKSHEYSDIYAATEIILKQKDFVYYTDLLQELINSNDVRDIIDGNIYGLIVLVNRCKQKLTNIDIIYKHCFDECLKVFSNMQNGIEPDDESIAITVLWRTLKEIIHYYIINCNFKDCLKIVTDVMLNINHLGLISYVFELFRSRLRNEKMFSDNELSVTINSIIKIILKNKFNLSRKGAGVALLFAAFAYNEQNKAQIIIILNNYYEEFKKRIDTYVIFINILTRLAKLDNNDQCKLLEYAFRSLEHKDWKIKNAGTMLFANLLYKLFGNEAYNFESKRHIFKDIRDLIYQNRNCAKYLVLCFYNRLKNLTVEEIEFISSCKGLKGCFKIKTDNILFGSLDTNDLEENKSTQHIEKTNDICIKVFTDLNNEDEILQNEAQCVAQQIGFENDSKEYLKHLIVKDSIINNYLEQLKASIKRCRKMKTNSEIYKPENNNDFYDYEYLIGLFDVQA